MARQPVTATTYRSLTQIIVEALRGRILGGVYEPGMRLNISDLAQQFEASPVPVREALRNLETEGLVQFRLNRGVVVRELSPLEVRELLLIRWPLEELAVKEAVQNVTPDDIALLHDLLKQMDSAAGQGDWHQLHAEFHHEFCALSGLPRLIQLIDVLRGQMLPYSKLYLLNPEHLARAQSEHHEMVSLLEAAEGKKLRMLFHEHIGRPARMALKALGARELTPETPL